VVVGERKFVSENESDIMLRERKFPMTDYNFIALCPICKEKRGVTCSREQARTGEPVKVYAIQCNHSWALSAEDSKLLLENSTTVYSG
jgi:hypothetical protein